MPYRQVRAFSGKGPGADRFSDALRGIAVDGRGSVFAVGDREVKAFDAEGNLRRRWSTDFPGYCVAIKPDDTIFVGGDGRIAMFSSEGQPLDVWVDAERLGLVTAIGYFGDDLLLADATARCIHRYDKQRRWLNDIGNRNNTQGFLIPNGYLDFAVDAAGIVQVCNPAAHRVERYTLDGTKLGQFGRFGGRRPEDFPGCCNPTNLTLSREGHVVVTEKAGPRLKVYDADGRLLEVVGPEPFDQNCKNMDVAVDGGGRVFVADTVRLSILVFAPTGEPGAGRGENELADLPGAARP